LVSQLANAWGAFASKALFEVNDGALFQSLTVEGRHETLVQEVVTGDALLLPREENFSKMRERMRVCPETDPA